MGFPGGQWQRIRLLTQEPQEVWVQSLGQEDPLEREMATHSSILAQKIPWTEEPGVLQSRGCKESDMTECIHVCVCVSMRACTHTHTHTHMTDSSNSEESFQRQVARPFSVLDFRRNPDASSFHCIK